MTRHLAPIALILSIIGTLLLCSFFPLFTVEGWRAFLIGDSFIATSVYFLNVD